MTADPTAPESAEAREEREAIARTVLTNRVILAMADALGPDAATMHPVAPNILAGVALRPDLFPRVVAAMLQARAEVGIEPAGGGLAERLADHLLATPIPSRPSFAQHMTDGHASDAHGGHDYFGWCALCKSRDREAMVAVTHEIVRFLSTAPAEAEVSR